MKKKAELLVECEGRASAVTSLMESQLKRSDTSLLALLESKINSSDISLLYRNLRVCVSR